MPKFVIERELPGAGEFSPEQLRAISAKSLATARELSPDIQWVHSFVTDDKVYCVINSSSVELIEQHGERGGFPVTRVSKVSTVIDPTTAEG
jgi:hypothetical protein